MKKPSRFLNVLGAVSLIMSLLVGAFGTVTVSAQDEGSEDGGPVVGGPSVFFPWVANDDESTGLGPADTSVTIQNLGSTEAVVVLYKGIGNDSLPGDNGWELIGPFNLEPYASKTFSAAQLGIAEGEGAPVGAAGVTLTGEITSGQIADYNEDGDFNDYETIADDDFMSGANQWMNTSPAELVSWADGDCLVVDIDNDGDVVNVYPAGYNDGGAIGVPGGTYPGQPGGNLDGMPDNCTASEAEEAEAIVADAPLAGVAKQAVEGENLPYTSDADTVVSGYNGLAGWELLEVGNEEASFNGWYLPIVQTNGGPGGAWNSIIRVANFGDENGVGAAGVTVTVYPADSAAGELNKSFSFNSTVNAGQTWSVDLSSKVPEGFVGSAHISSDAPIFAMVDRVKVGYNMWITNTASNALITASANPWGDGGKFVLYAPDVRKDFFGWNTGINVANLADFDNLVTIQYLGDIGAAAQTATLHAKGMTYFYDPSQGPQDNSAQQPHDPDGGTIGAAILIADAPIAAAIDATKYPESTTAEDHNIFQALSYSATKNIWWDQGVPLVQKGDPDTGMGATSGIQIFNPNDVSADAVVTWRIPSGDTFGNPVTVKIDPNAMTFVYTMTDQQLSVGYLGSATVNATQPVAVVSTQVDYGVQFDGSAVWNGYNPAAAYRDQDPQPDSVLDAFVTLDGEAAEGVLVNVYADDDCGGEVLYSGTTDANGEVEIPVEPGDYCVGADPNNDGTETYDEDVTIEPGDTNQDVDAEIDEAALPGIADVEVEGAQCVDVVDEVDTAVACDESTTGEATATTTVVIVPVADANVLCADVDYSTGTSMTYDPTDNSFELEVDPGLYCAMADLDGDPNTDDRLYSAQPFEIESNDPETDVDDVLGANAYLDVQVTVDFNDGTDPQPVGGVEVTIYPANEGDTTCSGTALGTFFTDANGVVSIPVEPGFYCAEADPNMDNTVTSGSGEVPLGDPSFAQTGDIDIDLSISESVAYLDVLVTLNGEVVPEGIPVQIYRGTCDNLLGPLGEPVMTDELGEITMLVAPGEYCAQAYPELGGEGTTGGVDLLAGDTDESGAESDIIIDVVVVLDVQVTLDGETPVEGEEVMIYAGDCETGTPLDGNPFTTDENGIVSVPVAPGDYCAEADPNNDTVLDNGSATLLPGDPSYADSGDVDIDITVDEEALPGIADGTVEGALCTDGETIFDCLEGPPVVELGAKLQQDTTTAVTQVYILSVADDTVDCAAQATYVTPGQLMDYDTANHFALEVARGWYCVMADLDGEANTTDRMYSEAPFFIESNDPADDNDFALTAAAWLDVVVQQDLGDTMLPSAGAEVEIYMVAEGEVNCPDSGTSFGIFITDENGTVSIPVQPGTYCAIADANGDDVLASDGPTFIPDGDPADDADLVITEDAAWLNVLVNLNGSPVGEGVSVEIFSGDCLTGASLGTLTTDAEGMVSMVVAPGDYCAEAYPELDGTTKTGSITGLEAGDTNEDTDITIDVIAVLDVMVTLEGAPVANGTEIQVFANPTDPADCSTGEALTGPFTTVDGVVSIPVAPGTYCVLADPNLDTTPSTGTAMIEPGDPANSVGTPDIDITIDEDFAPGTADVQVASQLCDVDVEPGIPDACDEGETDVVTTVMILTNVAPGTDCTTADYGAAQAAAYNDADDTFELEGVLPGLHCARADLDGIVETTDYIYTAALGESNPFETTTADPNDDVDTILEGTPTLGIADIVVAFEVSSEAEVTIVRVPNQDIDCTMMDYSAPPGFVTSLNMGDSTYESVPVAPGYYCTQVDPDPNTANDELYSGQPYLIDSGDPNTDTDDTVAGEGETAILDVDLVYSGDVPAGASLAGQTILIFTGDATTTVVDGVTVCTASQSSSASYTLLTSDTGEVQQSTLPDDYCAQVEVTINDGGIFYTGSAAAGTILAAGDPADAYGSGNITLTAELSAEPGTADVEVLDFNDVALSTYTVYVAPLGTATDCAAIDFTADGTEATFIAGDDTYEVTDLVAGDYCAVADLDGDLATATDQILSSDPFPVTSLDPDNDTDETLREAMLDVEVQHFDESPYVGISVEIYVGPDCTGTPLGTFVTDSNGQIGLVVSAGEYCATALIPTENATITTIPISVSGTVVPSDNPADDDIVIQLSRLGVETLVDDSRVGDIEVFIYPDGLCGGPVLYTLTTATTGGDLGIARFELPIGEYCVSGDPNGDGIVEVDTNVDIAAPNTDLEAHLAEFTDAATTVVDVAVPSGTIATVVTIVGVDLSEDCSQLDYDSLGATLTFNSGDDTYEINAPHGQYCAQADINGDGSGPIFTSTEPFDIPANDPNEDAANADETLGLDQVPTDPTASIFISAVPTGAVINLDLLGPEAFSITVQVTNTSGSSVDGTLALTQSGLLGGILGGLLDGTLTCNLTGTQDITVPANSTIDVTFSRTDCNVIFNITALLDVLNHFEATLTQDGLGEADHEEWNVLIDLRLL